MIEEKKRFTDVHYDKFSEQVSVLSSCMSGSSRHLISIEAAKVLRDELTKAIEDGLFIQGMAYLKEVQHLESE